MPRDFSLHRDNDPNHTVMLVLNAKVYIAIILGKMVKLL